MTGHKFANVKQVQRVSGIHTKRNYKKKHKIVREKIAINLKKEKEPRKQSLMNSVIISKRNISFNKGSKRSFHFSVSDVKM